MNTIMMLPFVYTIKTSIPLCSITYKADKSEMMIELPLRNSQPSESCWHIIQKVQVVTLLSFLLTDVPPSYHCQYVLDVSHCVRICVCICMSLTCIS